MRKGFLPMLVAAVAALVAMLAIAPVALATEFTSNPVPGPTGSNGLPNNRVYELVTPPDKYGGEAGYSKVAAEFGRPPLYSLVSPSGASILFSAAGSFGQTASGLQLYDVARRDGGQWVTSAATPPVLESPSAATDLPLGFLPATNLERFAYTTQKASVSGQNAQSLAGADRANSPNLYLTAEGEQGAAAFSMEPAWIARPQSAAIEPALGSLSGIGGVAMAGASPTLSRVYFGYTGTLLPQDAARAPHVAHGARGFYEWSEGSLHEAATLPGGGLDEYGAEPASVSTSEFAATPENYDHQVSSDGQRAFFVSPSPAGAAEACNAAKYEGPGGCLPEIYARIHEAGRVRTVLVSRDELTGGAAPISPWNQMHTPGITSLATTIFASPDGSRVFFADEAALTTAAQAAPETEVKMYEDDLEARGGEGEVRYVPGIVAGVRSYILGMSANGSKVLFFQGTTYPRYVELWERRAEGEKIEEVVTPVAESRAATLRVDSVRVTASGSAFLFVTKDELKPVAPATGGPFNPEKEFNEIYRYSTASGTLDCISCTAEPTADATLSHDDESNNSSRILNTSGMNAEGTQVFFDTAEALVPQALNHARNVYEWQADGTGGCRHVSGCVYLISSGTSLNESFVLGNSESGEDVFFATTAALSPEDKEGGYDVYDARVGGHASVVSGEASGCGGECEKAAGVPATPSAISEAAGPSGNLLPPPSPKSSTAGAKHGKGSRAARKRKLRHCQKAARHRRSTRNRRRALRRCVRRFGRAASRRGHRDGRRHHGHGHARRHGHGKRRRG